MSNPEVIDLIDSDGDDTIEVISEHHNNNNRDNLPLSQLHRPQQRNVIRLGSTGNAEDDDDGVEIVEERIDLQARRRQQERERERQSTTPGYMIHVPGGPIPAFTNEGSAEPERRSFQNARGPETGLHYRRPAFPASSDDAIRNRQREERLIHQGILRNRNPIFRDPRHLPVPHTPPLRNIRQRNNTSQRGPILRNGSRINFQWGNLGNLLFGDDDDDFDPTYRPGMIPPQFLGYPAGFQQFLAGAGAGFGAGGDNGGVDQHIMNLIEQRENQEADKKRSINENEASKYQRLCNEKIKTIKTPFSNKLDPEEEYVCLLCGVTLGEGIPKDFNGNIENIKLPILQEQNDVNAPYQAVNLVTDADRDLSKRIFMSTCGHTYCGRCVKNISTVKETLKELKRNKIIWKRNDQNIKNPFLYAPGKCCAPDCGVGLCARRRFTEVYI
ncbi:E3 ubiquitin-protein ligase [Wickerhamomyces ciferrii]|uniref:E3 ubiquitin-protein ligase n=1 Tax=Wickerhamomyces ciferrii (strain ATCC 14091 / BCRC 22168 / CBS 111 / JCM 3599 / NBRC 0793 / NRRL Y-1031 F-60-10) TaxID=1206466 RepID=K0KGY0_WICCF|nr:E3 ubiquitin-protein ligase [Wickerhamomyces ciferrii]CCH44445.1 E3 ubiquitin-protein ligase [Wickerhamomyces ciferrii]